MCSKRISLREANLSRRTAAFLIATFGFDVVAVVSLGLAQPDDEQVIDLAKREQRVVITFDLDLGKLHHWYERGRVGIIVLRIAHQSVTSVHCILGRFFADPTSATIVLERSLVVIDDARVRVITEPDMAAMADEVMARANQEMARAAEIAARAARELADIEVARNRAVISARSTGADQFPPLARARFDGYGAGGSCSAISRLITSR